ncbi:urease accessory protein UreD [Georgenia sp. M64]|uniref:urease accessory protein UreD n=1 Tax=Georgenia sp. M64 TaxID=3120520 RepID=UPI0030DFBCBE
MDSQLLLEFAALPGGTSLVRRRFSWPFFVARELRSREFPEASVVTLQSASGTLNSGDRTTARFVVGAGAHAMLRSQGAPSVHRATGDAAAAEVTDVLVGAAGVFDHVPEPRILFPGAIYEQTTTVRLSDGGRALLGDAVIALQGESGRSFRRYTSELRVYLGDELVVHDTNSTGPWDRMPGRVARFIAVGQVVAIAEPGCRLPIVGPEFGGRDCYIAGMRLPNDAGVLVRIAATSGRELREVAERVAAAMRAALARPPKPAAATATRGTSVLAAVGRSA